MTRTHLVLVLLLWLARLNQVHGQLPIDQQSPLREKAKFFQQDLVAKHWLEGLYVSIVPAAPWEAESPHTVDVPGNVIHAGVWTGRYLAGVAYHYAVTRDPAVREHGGQILLALRRLREVTGKPGLLARGYVKGHGPVMDYERDGRDSAEWHQGQGPYADYRWYGDVSVDNFNAVLHGYAVYYDLAADQAQQRIIAHDTARLMTHLLDNHCRIIDVDGEVTRYGHVGIDPHPDREEYYRKLHAGRGQYYGGISLQNLPLRASLMLLPDLLIAHHITGDERYAETYRRVVERFKDNPEPARRGGDDWQQQLARMDHSPEGQAYEAIYNLIRYEKDPELLRIYRQWVLDLWDRNWQEGNSLFTYMTFALLPEYAPPRAPGERRAVGNQIPHGEEALGQAHETLVRYPVDRVLRPVMNSLREDLAKNPYSRPGQPLSAAALPIDERPLDNEYAWKGNPYQMDGWLKPTVVATAFSCDDPRVAWFCDSGGRLFMTLDGSGSWRDMTASLMGAQVRDIVASPTRTFVLWAQTDCGLRITRDGGMSWREASPDGELEFPLRDFGRWQSGPDGSDFRVNERGELVRRGNDAQEKPEMNGWPIQRASSLFSTPWGIVASGPGGCYLTCDGKSWKEIRLWREDETGAADFLHAYWMGRYYGFVPEDQ